MKKSLLALAALALFAGAASAQSSVTIYGKIDLGLVLDSGSPQGKSVRVSSGASGASRLGFKGVEDLGGGYKAAFQLETGFCADSAAGAPNYCSANNNFMGRLAQGTISGSFGALSAGRQYTLGYLNLSAIDPFSAGYSGKVNNVVDPSGTRVNNSATYRTPTIAGFSAAGEIGLGETTGNWQAGRETGAGVYYTGTPVYAGVTFYDTENTNGNGSSRRNLLAGGTVEITGVKLHALVQKARGEPTGAARLDSFDIMGGASVPLVGGMLMASYLHHNDQTAANKDASQWALGYNYPLSKRTALYASYARINNQHGATYTVGNQTETGTGNKALDLGVVHNF